MIKIENAKIYGVEEAIRGMRNSFNSWDKTDSYQTVIETEVTGQTAPFEFFIGEKDLTLMESLDNQIPALQNRIPTRLR